MSRLWAEPGSPNQATALGGYVGSGAPLVAGFELASVVLLLTSDHVARAVPLAGPATVALVLSASLMVFSIRYGFWAVAYWTTPADRLMWNPAAAASLAELSRERRALAGRLTYFEMLRRRAENLFELGLVVFLLAVVLVIIPVHWRASGGAGWRWGAAGIAAAALAIQALWTAGKWLHEHFARWHASLRERGAGSSAWPARGAAGVRRADRYLVRGLRIIWPPARPISAGRPAPPGRDALLGLGGVPADAIRRLIRAADRAACVTHLARESARLARVVAAMPAGASVPAPPGADGPCSADDLLWHLTGQYWFWTEMVRGQYRRPGAADPAPARPPGRAALLEVYLRASKDLREILEAAGAGDPAGTAAQQKAGLIGRGLAHETLLHRVDAEMAAAARTGMDPGQCADGVDEVLRVVLSAWPEDGRFAAAPGQALRLRADDTGDTWLIRLGTSRRTGPQARPGPAVQVAAEDPGGDAAATVAGGAADLDCWLWRRPPAGLLEQSGDPGTLSSFAAVLRSGAAGERLRRACGGGP